MTSLVTYDIPALSDRTFEKFRELIYNEMGIYMRDNKKMLISNRLRKRLLALKIKSYEDYYHFLITGKNRKEELQYFYDAISTNETYFFREDHHYELLKKTLLPERMSRKKNLKIWSAGCSTGEEPYSLCMVLLESAGSLWKGEISIIATDINSDVIQRAKNGIYSGRSFRVMPEKLLSKDFTTLGNGQYQIREDIRNMVHFKLHNLLRDDPPGCGFDFIFCRNVMIYFDKPTQKRLVDGSFARALLNDGYLFIGHSESLIGASDVFRYTRIASTSVYRKNNG